MPLSKNGFSVKKIIGFIVFSLRDVAKTLVLLCFRSKILRNHWFYCVFAQTCGKIIGFTVFLLQKDEKNIGFTVFSVQNVKKPLVLLRVRSKTLKKHWFYCVFAQKC